MKPFIIPIVSVWLAALPACGWSLTAEEILLLKQNGVSEKTIQLMLKSEAAALQAGSGNQDRAMGVRSITRPDGQRAIVYSTGTGASDQHSAEERLKEERAWEMLRHLIVDTRSD